MVKTVPTESVGVAVGKISFAGDRRHYPYKFQKVSPANSDETFRCGNHVAHHQLDAATTTVGLEIAFQGRRPTRQCFAVSKTQASDWRLCRLRVSGRIDKKLTNRAERPNRPEGRVPESDGDRPGLHSFRRRWFPSPLLWTPSQGWLLK